MSAISSKSKGPARHKHQSAQGKNWIFTLNNPAFKEDGTLEAEDDPNTWKCRWFHYQVEKGTEGTEHLQGYCVWDKNKRLTALKKLNSKAHWEIRKGSHQQALDYCSKEDTRVRLGETKGDPPIHQGERSDLDEIKSMFDSGASQMDVANFNFANWCRYRQSFKEYEGMVFKARERKTISIVLYGPTNVGKTSRMTAVDPNACCYMQGNDKVFWLENYSKGQSIMFDEFTPDTLKVQMFNTICDKFPGTLPKKGGSTMIDPPYAIFSSNYRWEALFPTSENQYENECRKAAYRRINFYFQVTSLWSMECLRWFTDDLLPEQGIPCLALLPPDIETVLGTRSKYDPQLYLDALDNFALENPEYDAPASPEVHPSLGVIDYYNSPEYGRPTRNPISIPIDLDQSEFESPDDITFSLPVGISNVLGRRLTSPVHYDPTCNGCSRDNCQDCDYPTPDLQIFASLPKRRKVSLSVLRSESPKFSDSEGEETN